MMHAINEVIPSHMKGDGDCKLGANYKLGENYRLGENSWVKIMNSVEFVG